MDIKNFASQLCEHCGISSDGCEIQVLEEDDTIFVQFSIDSEDSGVFIGTHGETLDSLQRLIRVVFAKTESKKIVVNVNNYREQRKEKLTDLTQSIAEKVLDTGEPYTFRSFMPAYERFIVHSTLSEHDDFSDLESISQGDGKYRRLTIQLKA